jgi:hypothetical protein
MSFDSHSAAPQRAHNAVSRLAELGVNPPKAVADAYAVLKRVEAKPVAVDRFAVRDAIITGAKPEQLRELAMVELTAPVIESAHLAARAHAAVAVTDSIQAHGDQLHRQLAKLAEAAISKLEAAAAVGDVPLARLIRDGRHTDAEAIASAEVVAAQLRELYSTRDRLLWSKTRPALDVTRWKDPAHTGYDFLPGLRKGGRLWFPDFHEAMDLAAQLHKAGDPQVPVAAG